MTGQGETFLGHAEFFRQIKRGRIKPCKTSIVLVSGVEFSITDRRKLFLSGADKELFEPKEVLNKKNWQIMEEGRW